jgi:polygalacturonase
MKLFLAFLMLLLHGWLCAEEKLNIRDFGAKGDGITYDTEAIQKAIDLGAKTRQIIFFPRGEYYIGPIYLQSNTIIELSDFAIIKGSMDTIDYRRNESGKKPALINAEKARNIRICGHGIVDGNGGAPQFRTFNGDKRDHRPKLILFSECEEVVIEEISLRNSGSWMQHYYWCKNLRLANMNIYNHVNMNNDGMDIDNCTDVIVSGCMIDSDDDALCLKSTDNKGICQNINVTNCILASNCNAIKLGTESLGGFKQINIANCIIKNTSAPSFWGRNHGLGGIVLDLVDGGEMNGISISGINMTGIVSPFFIRLGDRGRKVKEMKESQPAGKIRNVMISDITATLIPSTFQAVLSGIPDHRIENVILSNIQLIYHGGGSYSGEIKTEEIPESIKDYPEATMFGRNLPVFGLMARHINNLQVNGLTIKVTNPDNRCAILLDDASNIMISNLIVDTKNNSKIGIYTCRSNNCNFENLFYINKPMKLIKTK